jgi:hypothetical protein
MDHNKWIITNGSLHPETLSWLENNSAIITGKMLELQLTYLNNLMKNK